ncbi:DUF1800 domain-containing protein [Gimesia aquarii]|uniref:DUF1800 domain-containing protein n=1 Tax=Gimesia aquarii TaxID=2527964 RepID=A0A517W3Z9_9PLAN|nr:DUF1800 domain-containing protein [Gimesia aquarii]QDT99973.1 hypothetical protein V144x_54870 [Gimesia aquarii]
MRTWQLYQPTPQQPWTPSRAAHLHRRTVFGATWKELQRDLTGKPQDAVTRVLSDEVRADGVPDEFTSLANLIGNAATEQPNVERLKAWWIYRVLFTPAPLQERLTLMWHNHFATSNLKVNNLSLMKLQNDTFRKHATAPFGDLLHAMLRDPALLIWLDASSNRRGHANENLGRELMELFTLGIGNYSESDVKNAARALTGLTVKEGQFHFDSHRHDAGQKTILTKTGPFNADQLADVLLQNPATAKRLASRLIGEFFSEGVVNETAYNELASQLRTTNLDIGKAVETILRSQLFFSDTNINSRICDPLSFLIAPLRALELFDKPPSTLALSEWLQRMGLDLFYPPNVAGWPGHRTWLTTRTVIARANYAAAVVSGEVYRPAYVSDLQELAKKHSAKKDDTFEKMMKTLLLGGATDLPAKESTNPTTDSREASCVLKLLTGFRAHLH